MKHEVIYIHHIPFKQIQLRIIALMLYTLKVKQIADCTGYEADYISEFIKDIHSKWDVHDPPQVMRKALQNGFDLYGHLNGTDVLEKRDRILLFKIAPHLKRESLIPA